MWLRNEPEDLLLVPQEELGLLTQSKWTTEIYLADMVAFLHLQFLKYKKQ